MLILYCSMAFLAGLAIGFFLRKNPANPPCRIHPVLTEWDRKCMAYHEAGHAVASYFLPEREKLIAITIDPSSDAFGMIRTAERPHHNETRISFASGISTLLAGRAAEEMFTGNVTTSCIHDLAAARQTAADMVLKFGMGKTLGLTALTNVPISETHAAALDSDIQEILRTAETQTRNILQEHSELVQLLAALLQKQKTLTETEIRQFFEFNGNTVQ